jgi:hypothetical protein
VPPRQSESLQSSGFIGHSKIHTGRPKNLCSVQSCDQLLQNSPWDGPNRPALSSVSSFRNTTLIQVRTACCQESTWRLGSRLLDAHNDFAKSRLRSTLTIVNVAVDSEQHLWLARPARSVPHTGLLRVSKGRCHQHSESCARVHDTSDKQDAS